MADQPSFGDQTPPRDLPWRLRRSVLTVASRTSVPWWLSGMFTAAALLFSIMLCAMGISILLGSLISASPGAAGLLGLVGGLMTLGPGLLIWWFYLIHLRQDIALLRRGLLTDATVVGKRIRRVYFIDVEFADHVGARAGKLTVRLGAYMKYHKGDAIKIIQLPGQKRILAPGLL